MNTMKKLVLLLLSGCLAGAPVEAQQLRTMTRSGAALGDSSLLLTSDTLTSKTTFVTRAASLAQLRKSLSKFTFDSLVVGSGPIRANGATVLTSNLTYGGVTLSNAVTGTGNMVLSASPTLTGTVVLTGTTITGTPTWSSTQTMNITGNVTGNVSGTAATVTTAAQPAITSVGTLTSLTVSGAFSSGAATVTTLAGTGAVSGFTTISLSATAATVATFTRSNDGDILSLLTAGGGGQGMLFGMSVANTQMYWKSNSSSYKWVFLSGTNERFSVTEPGVGTFAAGLNVLSGTTAVQALTATTGQFTPSGVTNPIQLGQNATSTTYGFVSFNSSFTNSSGLGIMAGGSGDAHLYFRAPSTGQFDFVVNGSVIASVLAAGGISATTGTFSTSVNTASGSQSCNNATFTTLFAFPGPGTIILFVYDNALSDVATSWAVAGDGTNPPKIGSFTGIGTLNIQVAGQNIQVQQNTGSTRTLNWSYIRIK